MQTGPSVVGIGELCPRVGGVVRGVLPVGGCLLRHGFKQLRAKQQCRTGSSPNGAQAFGGGALYSIFIALQLRQSIDIMI